MKKIISIILILATFISLTACFNSNTNGNITTNKLSVLGDIMSVYINPDNGDMHPYPLIGHDNTHSYGCLWLFSFENGYVYKKSKEREILKTYEMKIIDDKTFVIVDNEEQEEETFTIVSYNKSSTELNLSHDGYTIYSFSAEIIDLDNYSSDSFGTKHLKFKDDNMMDSYTTTEATTEATTHVYSNITKNIVKQLMDNKNVWITLNDEYSQQSTYDDVELSALSFCINSINDYEYYLEATYSTGDIRYFILNQTNLESMGLTDKTMPIGYTYGRKCVSTVYISGNLTDSEIENDLLSAVQTAVDNYDLYKEEVEGGIEEIQLNNDEEQLYRNLSKSIKHLEYYNDLVSDYYTNDGIPYYLEEIKAKKLDNGECEVKLTYSQIWLIFQSKILKSYSSVTYGVKTLYYHIDKSGYRELTKEESNRIDNSELFECDWYFEWKDNKKEYMLKYIAHNS